MNAATYSWCRRVWNTMMVGLALFLWNVGHLACDAGFKLVIEDRSESW